MPAVVAVTEVADALACADVIGNAFADEAMMRFPTRGPGDPRSRVVAAFRAFVPPLARAGALWADEQRLGAAVWLPPDDPAVDEAAAVWRPDPSFAVDPDAWDAYWQWVADQHADEPAWHLDSVGVRPEARGRGIGSALIRHGLDRADRDRAPTMLEATSDANVALYQRFGFVVEHEARAPHGGPLIRFMRREPGAA